MKLYCRKWGLIPQRAPLADMTNWNCFLNKLEKAEQIMRIGLVGKYVQLPDAYKSIIESLIQASAYNDRKLKLEYILSDDLTSDNIDKTFSNLHGIVVAPGFGNRGIEGKFVALRYAREHNLPCFGICLGMQTMSIEFARNVLGYTDANSTEIDPDTSHKVVDIMDGQKNILNLGGSMRLGAYQCTLKEGSKVFDIYEKIY